MGGGGRIGGSGRGRDNRKEGSMGEDRRDAGRKRGGGVGEREERRRGRGI